MTAKWAKDDPEAPRHVLARRTRALEAHRVSADQWVRHSWVGGTAIFLDEEEEQR